MPSYVYTRVNKENGRFYIGKADDPERRWANENCYGTLKQGRESALEHAIKKYGPESFDNYIVAKCKTASEAYKIEEELITICRCIDASKCYNLTNGGENPPVMYGDDNPMRNPSVVAKFKGENNPAKRADVRAKMSENHADVSRENNPRWKDYARILKNGTRNGKQRYGLKYDGKIIKTSTYPEKLKQYAIEHNLPFKED